MGDRVHCDGRGGFGSAGETYGKRQAHLFGLPRNRDQRWRLVFGSCNEIGSTIGGLRRMARTRDLKLVRKPTAHMRALNSGYEPGSVASTFSKERQREFREWLKRHQADSRVYERQLMQGTARSER